MKYTLPLSCLFTAGVILTGCQTNTMMMTAPTNGQIVKDIIVVDHGEIAAAKLAKKKAVNSQVRHLADYLYSQHTTCLHRIMKLSSKTGIKPEDSHLSKQLQMHNADEMKMLEASNRHDFDKNYVDAMVRDHQDALAFLDKAIKDSTNPTLTKDLQEARHHIVIHLEKAKKVQQHMG